MTPPDNTWQPVTFRERGVAVPFTSPMLAGARVRLSERRCDLLVPHPGGVRGVYIFAPSGLTDFCVPTLHDMRLADRLAGIRDVSPAAVRFAARAIASGGAAGRQAAKSAQEAEAQDRQTQQAFEHHLLLAGAKGSEGTSGDTDAAHADLSRLAELLAASGLDVPCQPPPGFARGRCTALLDGMDALRTTLLAWSTGGGSEAVCAQIGESIAAFSGAGRWLLGSLHTLLKNPAPLIKAWASRADVVAAQLGRVDWLLDGWQHLCLLWQFAEDDAQRTAAAAEINILLPPMPPEADGWLAGAPGLLAQLHVRPPPRPPGPIVSPGSSDAVSLVARNERIRAMAA